MLLDNKKLSILFKLSMITGVAIAIYIYIFNFNTYSETTMIMLSPFWILPIVFGYYGRLSIKMQKRLEQSEHKSLSGLVDAIIEGLLLRYIGIFALLPFKLMPNGHPAIIALAGALLWGILLIVFFLAIFPML